MNYEQSSPWALGQSHTQASGLVGAQILQVCFYGALLLGGAYFVLQRLDIIPLLPLTELVWNIIVYATPSSLVMALDDRAKTALAKEQEGAETYSESRTFAAKSEAMRRVFGIDGMGLVTKIQRTRTFSGVGSLLKGTASSALPGLGNLDNSCYQNSIIQGLASLQTLPRFLHSVRRGDEEEEDGHNSTIAALNEIIEKLNDPENAGQRFWAPSVLKSMSSWTQQDAQEYFSKIIDDLEKEAVRNLKQRQDHEGLREVTQILRTKAGQGTSTLGTFAAQDVQGRQNPLEGLLAQRVGCLQCRHVEGLSLIPFNCVTLPLESAFRAGYSIAECLDKYTDLENIDGVDCGRCTLLQQKRQLERICAAPETPGSEGLIGSVKARLRMVDEALENDDYSENTISKKCQVPKKARVSSTKTRQAVIARCPDSLVLHVNRSVFDETTFAMTKNNARVTFPGKLDLSSWCLGRITPEGDNQTQSWNTNPEESLLAGAFSDDGELSKHSIGGFTYALRSIIIHQGRHENGHYVNYRRDPTDVDHWWRLSDENVYSVSEQQVLMADGVYMLFYDRIRSDDEVFVDTSDVSSTALASTHEEELATTTIASDSNTQSDDEVALNEPAQLTSSPETDDTSAVKPNLRPEQSEEVSKSLLASSLTPTATPTEETSQKAVQALEQKPRDESQTVVPTMRTAGARKKRSRKGKQRGMAEMSNMVVAN